MKAQNLLFILFGILLSYLILNINIEQKHDEKLDVASDNRIVALVDSFPKYVIAKDGIITPKGMKYHMLIVPVDTAQNWTIKKMSIPKDKKFHLLIPEIE